MQPTGPLVPVSPVPARVVLYVRAGCHLCDDARAVVAAVAAERGATWAEVDVDAGGVVPDGRSLADVHGELVPVVEVDGARVGYWQIDADRLRDALAAPPTA
ncbi:glutaredoxin family protein [Cellulomonas sp. P4]|uniref:glutaredoxin family protein n=1 Tax=Cellulomonas sp. P4 TaxID=3142533 RepID=UPI0031BA80E3